MLRSLVPMLLVLLCSQAGAKGTGYVFVSNEKTNNIAVIDPKQDYRVIKWIDTSHRPRDMQFRDDNKQLLVACGDDDVIDVIDVANLKVVDHIPTGSSPELFQMSRDGKEIYVSNEEGSAVQKINVADKIIEQEIATGAEPEGIALGTEGKVLYVTSEVTDMVHVVDLGAGVVTDNIIVGTRPRRFLLLPNGKELWVSNELSGQVSIIDRAKNEVSASINFLPPGFRQVDVTPVGMTMTKDGKTAIVALGRSNHIAFVDTETRKIEDYVLVGNRAWGVALSPDEKVLFVANGLSDDVSIVDMASRKAIKAVPVGRVPHTVRVRATVATDETGKLQVNFFPDAPIPNISLVDVTGNEAVNKGVILRAANDVAIGVPLTAFAQQAAVKSEKLGYVELADDARYADNGARSGIVFADLGRPYEGGQVALADARAVGRVIKVDFSMEKATGKSVDDLVQQVSVWIESDDVHFILADLPGPVLRDLAHRRQHEAPGEFGCRARRRSRMLAGGNDHPGLGAGVYVDVGINTALADQPQGG